MIRKEENGSVSFSFAAEEWKKIKYGLCAAGAVAVLAAGAGIYSAASMASLRSENELYRNQLKMAEEKMEGLEEKTQAVEKLSNELRDMLKGNTASPAPMSESGDGGQGGQGGGSTVPDRAGTADPHQAGSGNTAKTASAAAEVDTPGDLLREMRRLDERLDTQLKMMMTLRQQLMSNTYTAAAAAIQADSDTPDIWPVRGEVSSTFGFRQSPGGIGSTYHEGIDIAGDYGTPIEATAAGTVTQAGWVSGYGYLVEVKHDSGIVTRYGHNSAIVVSVGQHVSQGDIVALMGSTGNSTGPHCHYEVRINGESVNPSYFLP